MTRFADRVAAGRELAGRLESYAGRTDIVVLGLARGGVPVAAEVARALDAPLDVFLVRKLGVPGHEELAMGAIASGAVRVLNEPVVREFALSDDEIESAVRREQGEIERYERAYRDGMPPAAVAGLTAIVVDDGLATGSSMRAAVRALRDRGVAAIVLAVPVASHVTCAELRDEADEVVCAHTPDPFHAVGLWYDDFTQTDDDEVREILRHAPATH